MGKLAVREIDVNRTLTNFWPSTNDIGLAPLITSL